MARDVSNLVKGMELLQPGFSNRYERAKERRASEKEITIGRLYVPGTDPKIEQAIDDALKATGFREIAPRPPLAVPDRGVKPKSTRKCRVRNGKRRC